MLVPLPHSPVGYFSLAIRSLIRYIAASRGHVETVNTLIEVGADPDMVSRAGLFIWISLGCFFLNLSRLKMTCLSFSHGWLLFFFETPFLPVGRICSTFNF